MTKMLSFTMMVKNGTSDMPNKIGAMTMVQVDYKSLARFLGLSEKEIIGVHTTPSHLIIWMQEKDDRNGSKALC